MGYLKVLYEYRAFGGQLKRLDSAGSETGDGAKYSYGGKELDGESDLYYFNARYYDATIGRFINVDPIQDGSNWYVYVRNNPLGLVDPTGLRLDDNLETDLKRGIRGSGTRSPSSKPSTGGGSTTSSSGGYSSASKEKPSTEGGGAKFFRNFYDGLIEFNEAYSPELSMGVMAEVKVSIGTLIVVAGKGDVLSARFYSINSQQGNKLTQGASLEIGVGTTSIKAEVGREAEGAEVGAFIIDRGYRERMSEPTTGLTRDTDTISIAAGLGIGAKIDISISESIDFLRKTVNTISEMAKRRRDYAREIIQ